MKFRGSIVLALLAFFCVLFSGGIAAAQVKDQGPGTDFFAEVTSVSLERPFWIAVPVVPLKGNYIPWIDAETGGRGVVLDFALPPGFEKGETLIDPPKALFNGEIFGYQEYFWIMQEIIPGEDAKRQDVYTIPGYVAWQECAGIECLDFEEQLALKLPSGKGYADPENAELFHDVRKELAQMLPWPVTYRAAGGEFSLTLLTGERDGAPFQDMTVLPDWGGDPAGFNSQLKFSRTRDGINVSGTAPGFMAKNDLTGFLYLTRNGKTKAYRFEVRNEIQTEEGRIADKPGIAGLTFWAALGFAFIGGLILNLMPCVFPVLTLKVFGLVKAGTRSPKHMKVDGLAFTAGILLTFAFVALLLLTFRAAGEQVGWGFQLQSPYFVTVLVLIIFTVTLSFAGLFDIRLPFAIEDKPGAEGAMASFYTGMLATVVATPCTAPFMAPALAFALTLPTGEALAIFLGLGIGMAFPYLLVSFVPAVQKVFPKPGRWMVILRKILAIPLLATVGWLVYVLHSQVGAPGVYAALSYMALIAGVLLAIRATKDWRKGMRWTVFAALAVIVAGNTINTLPVLENVKERPKIAGGDVQEWSDEAVWNYRLQGKGVFVNYTATWCLTCIVNEKTVFAKDKFQQYLVDHNIVYMEADWTNHSAAIKRSLEDLGRSALPVYVFYPPGGPTEDPVLLPEILTLDKALEILDAHLMN